MTNAEITTRFLSSIGTPTRKAILTAIAEHYGIDNAAALAGVTGPDAEHLLDYLTGSVRTATSLLMKRHGLSQ